MHQIPRPITLVTNVIDCKALSDWVVSRCKHIVGTKVKACPAFDFERIGHIHRLGASLHHTASERHAWNATDVPFDVGVG